VISTRLVAYAPGADVPLGHLPEPLSWQCSLPHNDVGALTLKYSTLAARGDLLGRGLAEGLDVALEVDFGSGWIEPDGARFLLRTRSRNLAGTDGVLDLALPSYGALLADMRILALELLEVGGDFDGQRLFTAVNAGKILRPLLDEYASRHAQASALTWSFTASLDSALVAWPSTEWAIPYQAGVDLRSVLGSEQTAGLTSLGLCDWRTRGRELMAWVKDSQAVDRSELVRLELSRDIRDAPLTETLDGTAGYTLVRGEGSVIATVISEDAPSPWGVAEAYLTASGATSVEAAQEMVALEVERRARETAEYTQQLTLDPDGVLPLRDYLPGDVISAPASGGRRAMRVQQVTLSMDGGELTGSVVLNDRMVPADLRVAGRLRAITGGSVAGGTGVVPVPARPIPKAPTGLSLSTNAWWNYGTARATVGATWSAVTESTEGKPILIASYRIRVTPVGFEGSAQSTSAVVDDLPTGTTVQVQVAAVSDLGVQGQWSNVAGISTAVPPDTLVPPTVLALSTGDGTVRAVWDGKLQAPPAAVQDPPGHFDRVIVQAAAAAGGPWSTQGSIHTAGGRWIIPGDAGATVYVRGIAVDRAGNQTGPGPVASIAVVSAVAEAVEDAQDAADEAMTAAMGAQTTADGKTRVSTSVSEPSAVGRAQGDLWQAVDAEEPDQIAQVKVWNGTDWVLYRIVAGSVLVPGSVGNVLIENGAITAPKLTVNQAMIDALAVGDLWAEKIKGPWLDVDQGMIDVLAVNDFWSEKIRGSWLDVDQAMIDALTVNTSLWSAKIQTPMLAAGAATVDKLSTGALTLNMIPNGNFADGWAGWELDTGYAETSTHAGSGGGSMRIYRSGADATVRTARPVPIDPTLPLYWRVRFGSDGYTPGPYAYIQILFLDAAGALVSYLNATWEQVASPWSWVTRSGKITPPAGARYVRINLTASDVDGTYFVDSVYLTHAIQGDLIVDGAIDGQTITGATVRTAASGARVLLAGSSVDVFGTNGNKRVSLDAPSATVRFYTPSGDMTGTIQGDAGGEVHITGGYIGNSSIRLGDGAASLGCDASIIDIYDGDIILAAGANVVISEPATTSSAANAYLESYSGRRRLIRSTSVRAAKRLIQDAPGGDFLALRPRTWYDRGEMETAGLDPDTATEADCLAAGLRRIPGFVAEEVEAVDPLYVTYDPSPDGPVLSGVAYDRLAAAIHPILTDLAARVAALEATH